MILGRRRGRDVGTPRAWGDGYVPACVPRRVLTIARCVPFTGAAHLPGPCFLMPGPPSIARRGAEPQGAAKKGRGPARGLLALKLEQLRVSLVVKTNSSRLAHFAVSSRSPLLGLCTLPHGWGGGDGRSPALPRGLKGPRVSARPASLLHLGKAENSLPPRPQLSSAVQRTEARL